MPDPTSLDVLFDKAAEAADAATRLESINGYGHAYWSATPPGWRDQVHDLERFALTPRRKTGTVVAQDIDSFIHLVERHRNETTTIYVDVRSSKPSYTAVITDTGAEFDPAWRDHRIVLTLDPTPEWHRWMSCNSIPMGQLELAERIEDDRRLIIDPDAAELLDMVQTMRGTKNVTWRSEQYLTNGQIGLEYTGTTTATAGRNGDVAVPEVFTLHIAPFFGAEPREIKARLRYRISDEGKLTVSYHLIDAEGFIQDAIAAETERVYEAFTTGAVAEHSVLIVNGRPDA